MKPILSTFSSARVSAGVWSLGLAAAMVAAPPLAAQCAGGSFVELASGILAQDTNAAGCDASPAALAASPDGQLLYVACATASQVAIYDTVDARIIGRLQMTGAPSGLALTGDGTQLYVTCAAPSSTLYQVDLPSRRIVLQVRLGHTAMAPVLSPDEKRLYVCNRFNHDVAVIDCARGEEVQRIRVTREPVAAAITPDGKYLVVANHLQAQSANDAEASAPVSIIDTTKGTVIKTVPLTLGANMLRGIALSPDGRFAAVTHLRSLFWLTTSSVDLGRINCNALTVLDMASLKVLGTLLLDQTARGAANPWAVTWTRDGKTIAVSHAGTHEISLVDAPVDTDPWNFPSLTLGHYAAYQSGPVTAPRHPVRVRSRVTVPGNGPRALAVAGDQLYVANYFSDNLCRIDLAAQAPMAEPMPFWSSSAPSMIRQGEMCFNDGGLCWQGWQSCASCHDADARADALNWDLLNDGDGNPKNTKSLVWAPQTPPVMALSVRTNAQSAVRAGIHHILFTAQPDDVPAAIDAYLQSLQPMPSPHLVNGNLSAAAQRGEKLFMSTRTGCAECHPPPLFTDLASHKVGSATTYKSMWGMRVADKPSDSFDTPTLVELWRTGPYLHDGSAVTVTDVLTLNNRHDQHGRTTGLNPQELADLGEFLLSL